MRKKWTEEACYEAALKCKSRSEYKHIYPSAYKNACKNGWLNNYTWFMSYKELCNQYEHKIKWTYEACVAEAKKYDTLKEFREKAQRCYTVSTKNGYLSEFEWLKRKDVFNGRYNIVYKYIFEEYKAVYIGRTVNPIIRHNAHCHSGSVYNFAMSHNLSVPDMTIIESELTLSESLIKEDEYINKFKDGGWKILNIAKTGLLSGSVGTLYRRWNYKNTLEEAKKYKSRNEFKHNNQSAYNAANKNKWMDDYVWFEKKNKIPVYQFSLNGDFIAKYESASEASRLTNKCIKGINACCNKRTNTAFGFIWRFEKDVKDNKIDIIKLPAIIQYSLHGKFIKRYINIRDVMSINQEYKSKEHILNCCNGLQKKAYGFIWKFESEVENFNDIVINDKISHTDISVIQYNTSGEFISKYNNIKEASCKLNINSTLNNISSTISKCCNRKLKTAYGFIWRFDIDTEFEDNNVIHN